MAAEVNRGTAGNVVRPEAKYSLVSNLKIMSCTIIMLSNTVILPRIVIETGKVYAAIKSCTQ